MHYKDLPGSYIVFVCNFDYFDCGLAVYERKSVIKGCEDVSYNDGSHVFILNSKYTQENADAPILEFLDYVRRDDSSASYQSALAKSVVAAVSDVRHDKEKEAIYMTYVQKIEDVKRKAMQEGVIKGAVSTFKMLGKSKESAQTFLEHVHSLSPDEARQETDKYW